MNLRAILSFLRVLIWLIFMSIFCSSFNIYFLLFSSTLQHCYNNMYMHLCGKEHLWKVFLLKRNSLYKYSFFLTFWYFSSVSLLRVIKCEETCIPNTRDEIYVFLRCDGNRSGKNCDCDLSFCFNIYPRTA